MPNKQPKRISVLAILSFIFAYLCLPLALLLPNTSTYLILIFFPIIGLILGVIALFNIKRNPSLRGRGWAIAGIIIIIFILILTFYYGFFAGPIPRMKCAFPMGFYCSDFSVVSGNPGYITFKIEIGMGVGIIIREINITSSTNETKCYIDLTKELPGGPGTYNNLDGWYLSDGEEDNVKIICNIKPSEQKKNMDIFISYCEDNATSNEGCKNSLHTIWGEAID